VPCEMFKGVLRYCYDEEIATVARLFAPTGRRSTNL
jgi:hypothetical protein